MVMAGVAPSESWMVSGCGIAMIVIEVDNTLSSWRLPLVLERVMMPCIVEDAYVLLDRAAGMSYE